MPLYFENGSQATGLYWEDGPEVCVAYWEDGGEHVFEKPGLVNVPVITDFGATDGSGKQKTLTVNATQLPIGVVISGSCQHTDIWTINRVVAGSLSPVAAGRNQTPQTVRAEYQEDLTSQLKPDSQGWVYNLMAENSTLGNCGIRHATCRVRLVTGPVLRAFAASSPSGVQTPSGVFQRSYLSWDADAGDPEATWSLSQSGTRVISHLPSSSRLTPANGRATGTRRQIVQTAGDLGGYTDLTLTGRGEGGTASRTVRIVW